jgi:hypothetical protein
MMMFLTSCATITGLGEIDPSCLTEDYIIVHEDDDIQTLRQALEHNLDLQERGCPE